MMSTLPSPENRPRQKLWTAVKFVFLGVGGLWVMMIGSGELILRVFDHDDRMIAVWLSLPLACMGALAMLAGVGLWGRWAYLWIFLSLPLSLFLEGLIRGRDAGKLPFGLFIAPVVSYAAVKGYYAWKDARLRKPGRKS